jgi:hypothetical protein
MKLHIAENLTLPIEAVTQTFAILGIRGSGKTNTAVSVAEEMLKVSQQVIVLDPTDAWYGIRSSRNGRSPGLRIYVMGGEHGDIPLEGLHGAAMAEFIVATGASVVFSLRHLSISDQRRFAQDFAERLYELKGKPGNRTPLHIFIDEADEFIPQRIPPGFERLFGAYDRLVRRGRSSGIGLTMISQRPQVLNKDTLSQCEILVCHRLLHKLDRKAVKEGWVEGHDLEGKVEEFMASLASLGRGEAWFWSPSWLDIFCKVQVRPRETFDSSFTPKTGEKPKIAKSLAPVDLDALKQKLAATIEKVKANDPKELCKQIKQLKVDLAKRHVETKPVCEPKIIEVPTVTPAQISELRDALNELKAFGSMLDAATTLLSLALGRAQKQQPGARVLPAIGLTLQTTNGRSVSHGESGRQLRDGAERMLAALCQFFPAGMPDGWLRSHAGLKKSGTYSAYKSDLFRHGYAEKRGVTLLATQAGLDYFDGDVPAAPQTTQDVVDLWSSKLRDGARRMLQRLIEHGGEAVPHEQLYLESELVKSGTASAYLGDLKRAQLALVTRDGVAANRETLFLG